MSCLFLHISTVSGALPSPCAATIIPSLDNCTLERRPGAKALNNACRLEWRPPRRRQSWGWRALATIFSQLQHWAEIPLPLTWPPFFSPSPSHLPLTKACSSNNGVHSPVPSALPSFCSLMTNAPILKLRSTPQKFQQKTQ